MLTPSRGASAETPPSSGIARSLYSNTTVSRGPFAETPHHHPPSRVPSTETPRRHPASRGHYSNTTSGVRGQTSGRQKSNIWKGCTLSGGRYPGSRCSVGRLPVYIATSSFHDNDKCIALLVAVDHGTGNTTSAVITRHA